MNVRIADEITSINFNSTFNLGRFVERILQTSKLNGEKVKVFHKGRVLGLLDSSMT